MVRTSKAQPSAMDAGALDDLDLDDMFADDGDMLFEGLDIQLEGMGDIITTEKKETNKGGARTKRPGAPPAEEEEGGEASKRRKTKRKTKTPVAFGDEDEEYFEDAPPKKKSKKSKAPTLTVTPPTTTTTKKKMKKTKKSIMTPPATGKANTTVAAAGRFGKRGSSNKVTKRKSVKADAEPATPVALPLFVPKQESTYGGLHPSKSQFYPFLEGIPSETTLKSRKHFPQVDKIFGALNAQLSLGTSGKGQPVPPDLKAAVEADMSLESPIIQLLIESFENISEKDKAAFVDYKKQTLMACIPSLRSTIEGMDPMKLLPDLYSMCGLLTRQFNFVKTSLTNMENWCKANFIEEDYRQAFSIPEPFKPEKVGTVITPANRKWKEAIITVNLIVGGVKEPKGPVPLQAKMPPSLVLPVEKKIKKVETTKSKKTKSKDKTASPSTKKKSSSTPSTTAVVKSPTAPKSYADCGPAERRQRILERVSQLAIGLESQANLRRNKRPLPSLASSAATTQGADNKASALSATCVPPEEPPLHTARMWEWIEAVGFFQMAPPADSQAFKQSWVRLKTPEIHRRRLMLSTPTKIHGRKEVSREQLLEDQAIDGKEANVHPSSNGLFDRLQSLLVVEDDGEVKNENLDSYGDESSDSDEECLAFLDEDSDDDSMNAGSSRTVDLSRLTVEERAFVHLKSAGLIKNSLFPKVELVLDENDGRKDDAIEDDLVNVIGEMSADLGVLTRRNNARIGYLESAMDPMDAAYRRQIEEENAGVIARCQNLLKRNKEKAKKSSKQKSNIGNAKDDLNLPW